MNNTILVADDEPFMVRLLQYQLEKAGYSTVTARDGREAVELATTGRPRLAILDVMMTPMDGLSALREIRENAATRGLPVILLTASAHQQVRDSAESGGATLFFTKPFSPTKLLEAVRQLAPLV